MFYFSGAKCVTTVAPEIEVKHLTLFGRSNQLELQERDGDPQTNVPQMETITPSETTTGPRFRSDYKYIPKVDGWMKLHHSHVNWFDALTRCRLEGSIYHTITPVS